MRRIHRSLLIGGAFLITSPAIAQDDVVLNPATIEGAVSVSGYTLQRARVVANGVYGSATQTITPNADRAFYSLTVNVPADDIATYSVYAQPVRVADPDGTYELDFISQTVDADETVPGVVDFEITEPAFVEGTVTLTGSSSTVMNIVDMIVVSSDSRITRVTHRGTPQADTYTFRIPVAPGTHTCRANVDFSNDTTQNSGDIATFTLAAGESALCDTQFTVVDPGTITGTVSFSGETPIDSFRIRTVGIDPTSVIESADATNSATYTLTDLTPFDYTVQVIAIANSDDDSLIMPNDLATATPLPVAVTSGGVATYNLTACQAYIDGELTLSGSVGNSDLSSGRMESIRLGGSGGRAVDTIVGGQFDLIVTEGDWRTTPASLRVVRTDAGVPDIDTTWLVRSTSDPALPIACGERLALPPRVIENGIRTINFSISTNELLSRPRLTGSCTLRDETTNSNIYRIDFSSLTIPINDVPTASIRVALPAGNCRIIARATVNGSNTEFGDFSIPVDPGTDVEIDVGAPSLTVNGPEPGICIAESAIEVSGFVRDEESDIAFVTVNDINATLTPIENDVYAFSVLVPLAGGVNTLVVVAEDTEGNAITDTRFVRQDAAPPIVTWTPADTTVVFQSTLVVSGIVSDDNEITEVLLNGIPVTLIANGMPGEYTFSEPVVLEEGSNTMTLLARDNSGCEETLEIRNVIYQLQQEPTGVTRTIGYWKNHPGAISNVLTEYGSVTRCDDTPYSDTCAIVGELTAKGNQNQANARRQSMAAALNCLVFGCDVDPQAACTHTLGEDMDTFNNSGDSLPFPAEFVNVSADPKFCK